MEELRQEERGDTPLCHRRIPPNSGLRSLSQRRPGQCHHPKGGNIRLILNAVEMIIRISRGTVKRRHLIGLYLPSA